MLEKFDAVFVDSQYLKHAPSAEAKPGTTFLFEDNVSRHAHRIILIFSYQIHALSQLQSSGGCPCRPFQVGLHAEKQGAMMVLIQKMDKVSNSKILKQFKIRAIFYISTL